MPWVKLDEQFRHHPKVIEAGAVGIALYVCGLSYAAEYLTDGFIATRAVRTLIDLEDVLLRGMDERDTIDPADVADGLVRVGLWDAVEGGYRIHDYLDYNPSKLQVMADRAAKQAAGRAGGQARAKAPAQALAIADAQAPAQADAVANAQAKSKPVPVPVPVTVSDSVSVTERENARDGEAQEDEVRYWLARHGCYVTPGNGYDRKIVVAVAHHGADALIGMMDRLASAGTKDGDIKGFLFGAIDELDKRSRPNLAVLEAEDREGERREVMENRIAATKRRVHEAGGHGEPNPGCPMCKEETA